MAAEGSSALDCLLAGIVHLCARYVIRPHPRGPHESTGILDDLTLTRASRRPCALDGEGDLDRRQEGVEWLGSAVAPRDSTGVSSNVATA